MFRFNRTLFSDFIDLLFPQLCLGCSKTLEANELVLCAQCRLGLPETEHHRGSYNEILLNRFAGKVSIKYATAYFYYDKDSIAQKLIHAIKYKGQKEAAREIAGWYGYQLRMESSIQNEIDLLVGVPLHKNRLHQRGYNQADWIATGLAEALDKPIRTDVLIRNRFMESQTRKNRMERWGNVNAVFAVTNPEAIRGKRIALVDDVLTTGATIEACAVELLNAGCESVSVLTLAITK